MRSTSSPRAVSIITGTLLLRAQAAQNLEAVEAGQHDIEHHQVDARLQGAFQAGGAFMLAIHVKPSRVRNSSSSEQSSTSSSTKRMFTAKS